MYQHLEKVQDRARSHAYRSSYNYSIFAVAVLLSIIVLILVWIRSCRLSNTFSSSIERDVQICEKESLYPSPFAAYLGYNVLTESSAFKPERGSGDAINRLERYLELENLYQPTSVQIPEIDVDLPTPEQHLAGSWKEHTYPDTTSRQLSFEQEEHVKDDVEGRRWLRRTFHIYGV